MNKGELVDAIWEKAGVSKSKADAILVAFADTIAATTVPAFSAGKAFKETVAAKPKAKRKK